MFFSYWTVINDQNVYSIFGNKTRCFQRDLNETQTITCNLFIGEKTRINNTELPLNQTLLLFARTIRSETIIIKNQI